MQPLEQLSAMEKGRLLHELFPLEIPALLMYIKEVCNGIESHQEAIRLYWKSTWCTADYWFTLANNANRIIEQYGYKLSKNSRLFAHQLFKGDTALFTIGCMVKYAEIKSNNEPFQKAIEMLFE